MTTRNEFKKLFPKLNCSMCVWFDVDVDVDWLKENYDDFVKNDVCVMSDYAFPCQFYHRLDEYK